MAAAFSQRSSRERVSAWRDGGKEGALVSTRVWAGGMACHDNGGGREGRRLLKKSSGHETSHFMHAWQAVSAGWAALSKRDGSYFTASAASAADFLSGLSLLLLLLLATPQYIRERASDKIRGRGQLSVWPVGPATGRPRNSFCLCETETGLPFHRVRSRHRTSRRCRDVHLHFLLPIPQSCLARPATKSPFGVNFLPSSFLRLRLLYSALLEGKQRGFNLQSGSIMSRG